MHLLRNSAWVALSLISGRGAVVLSSTVIAYELGASAFAAFVFSHVTATFLSNLAMVGMQDALPWYFARLAVDDGTKCTSQIIVGLIVAGVGLGLSAAGILALPKEVIGLPKPATKTVLTMLVITIGLNTLSIAAANAREEFRAVCAATLAQGSLLLTGVLVAAYLGKTEVALYGYVVATLAGVCILLSANLRAIAGGARREGVVLTRALAWEVMLLGGPLLLSASLLNAGMWLSGRSLLAGQGGTRAFAEFALGFQWFGIASFASAVIGRVMLPRLTRFTRLHDLAARHRTVWQGMCLAVAASSVVALAVWLFSSSILSFYGPELAGAGSVLVLFVTVAIFGAPVDAITFALVAINRQATLFYMVLLWWCTLVALLYVTAGASALDVVSAIVVAYSVLLLVCVTAGLRHGVLSMQH